ncbi:MAG: adenylate/guanylate cyclase domain-containing protein [Dehalococcoidia bacterium]
MAAHFAEPIKRNYNNMSDVLRPGASPGSRTARSERRILSLMFCDVVNSTALAEKIDPEEWVEIMNEAFEKMTAPILRYEGTIGKFTGDGMMAFFGAPVSHEDDSERAVRAGLEILEGIDELKESVRRDYGEEFNLRIGINTGLAVVGEVGSSAISEYTAMGDAVNVAARMEQSAQPGTLQISADTQKLVENAFIFEPLGGIEVKGKSAPVDVFKVTSALLQTEVTRTVVAPLIGRDKELNQLIELTKLTKSGNSQVVSIIGEAGLGKSRLLAELRKEWIKTSPEHTWEFTQGIPYDMGRPYSLFQALARGMFGVELNDSPEVIHAKVDELLRSEGGTEEEISLCSVAVEKIIAAKALHDAPDHSAEAIKNDVREVVIPAWMGAAQHEPIIAIFDDLQWSDDASKELLIHMTEYLAGTQMMVVLAFRPDPDSPAQQVREAAQRKLGDRYTEIVIEPLDHDHTNELITALLQIRNFPTEARELVLRKAEGNPYFVEEVVRWFVDQNMVRNTANGLAWDETSDLTNTTMPDSLQSLLMSRMDRLTGEAKDTLQLASVIGRAFYHSVLGKISDSALELDKQLTALETQEMIHEQIDEPELQYLFKHELTRDAAYSTILRRRRRTLHHQVAEAMETVFEGNIETNAHRLGYHFSEAGDHEHAMKYFEMATDIATGIDARSEAESHLRNAIAAATNFKAPEAKNNMLKDRLTELVTSNA